MNLALIIVLLLIFAIGVLELTEDDATFAQVARGLATMVLAVIGMALVSIG